MKDEHIIIKGALSLILGALTVCGITTAAVAFPIYFDSNIMGYLFFAGEFILLFAVSSIIMKIISGRWLYQ
jgi:hypothetical protein